MNFLAPDRVAELIRCLEAGYSIRETARATNTAKGTVERYRRIWRGGKDEAEESVGISIRLDLTPKLHRALKTEARKRGVAISSLASEIIGTVCEDDLFADVLA